MPGANRVEVIFPAPASDRGRTCNLLITRQLLCQLSYRSIFRRGGSPDKRCKSPYYPLSASRTFCQLEKHYMRRSERIMNSGYAIYCVSVSVLALYHVQKISCTKYNYDLQNVQKLFLAQHFPGTEVFCC